MKYETGNACMKVVPIVYPWKDLWIKILLFSNGKECVLLDSGTKEEFESDILPAIQANGIDLRSISRIIYTHSHGDHTDGSRAFAKKISFRCAIHEAGAAELRQRGFEPDILPADGMVISEAGFDFEIIHTPGHSPDSVCVLERSGGILFTGDSVQGTGIKAIGTGLWQDSARYRQSMNKLLDLYRQGKISRMHTGHPFYCGRGEFEGQEIALVLQDSISFADRCTSLASEMLDADFEEFYQALLKLGNTPVPFWETAARSMAHILRNEARTDTHLPSNQFQNS